MAAEICAHLTGYGQTTPASPPPPSACVATCPAVVRDRETGVLRPFDISEADMLRVRVVGWWLVGLGGCLCCCVGIYMYGNWLVGLGGCLCPCVCFLREANDFFGSLYTLYTTPSIHLPVPHQPPNTNNPFLFSPPISPTDHPTNHTPPQVIEAAAREPLEPTHEKDMEVPSALMSQEQVRKRDVCLVGGGLNNVVSLSPPRLNHASSTLTLSVLPHHGHTP